MVGSHPPLTTDVTALPLPRRPLDATAHDDDPVRRWYENDLGWPTVPASTPGSPVRLRTGLRFDVLDVPLEAGRAALRHLADGSPVAVRGDRMRLLVAAGSAEELPGILEWLEWASLPLDLRAIGTDGSMTAPSPPGATPSAPGGGSRGPGGPTGSAGSRAPGMSDRTEPTRHRTPWPGERAEQSPRWATTGATGATLDRTSTPDEYAKQSSAQGSSGCTGATPEPGGWAVQSSTEGTTGVTGATRDRTPRPGGWVVQSSAQGTTGVTGAAQSRVPGPGGSGEESSASGAGRPMAAELTGPGRGAGARPLVLGRPGALQGAAVWLRPPEPGCEVEASLPTMSALGGVGGAPDLVRVVDTVATQCHRLRLRRARP